MTTIKIELDGQEELVRNLSKISKAVATGIAEDAVTEGAAVVQYNAQLNATHVFSNKQTGALRNSIAYETKQTGTGAEAEIGPSVIYARIQEYGGTIRPVHAQALHWVMDGQDYFAKQVTLPARPYLRPAAEDHITEISQVMKETIADGIAQSI